MEESKDGGSTYWQLNFGKMNFGKIEFGTIKTWRN
jgi:hypothetical protein